jgi:small subunit ribosomal protein S21
MLIIDTRDSESLDKALRKYKKKYDRSGVLKQLRSRQAFTKPSVARRDEIKKAAMTLRYIRENNL